MAQYKVPQDVEADDKLLGPFSFRQFIYLAIAGGGVALAVALWQLFPLLAIIPVPVVIFFLALALPLKKDQPMETYLAAVMSYHFKPRKRFWVPGQRETTIEITAPKVAKKSPVRDISREEASHRLSFLAEVIDSEGRSVQNGAMSADFLAEANNVQDVFDISNNNLDAMILRDAAERRAEIINSMRDVKVPEAPHQISHGFMQPALNSASPASTTATTTTAVTTASTTTAPTTAITAAAPASAASSTTSKSTTTTAKATKITKTAKPAKKPPEKKPTVEDLRESAAIAALAEDKDLSIETISKEAKRIKEKKKHKDEVYIALH